jgi:FkbM family methyltransferase
MKKTIIEWLRCTKHNLFDHPWFTLRYQAGLYHVQTNDGVRLLFPHNPYLAFYQIGGYLREGSWRLTPGMVVIDAGACLGEFSLYAAGRVGPTGQVLLLEPDPDNLACLEEIFAINGGRPSNLHVIAQGLWREPGTVQFAAGITEQSHIVALNEADQEELGQEDSVSATTMLIPVQSLMSLIDSYALPRLDFVKMDIEGAEVESVAGAIDILPRFRPKFAIASYHVRNGRQTAEILPALFAQANYHVQTGFPRHLTTYASPTPFATRA